ncbi:8444_t:CDS:2 [Ambispora gerdemannii]|uniref:Origin recognition complex subunit 4 n=1 Tax=Ambispora gerdemannii TaxID=144530 RepID=A0A9N8WMQ1_9GLOM|nr:8444_t:CDS:2 [Ambispora gerdemannii]
MKRSTPLKAKSSAEDYEEQGVSISRKRQRTKPTTSESNEKNKAHIPDEKSIKKIRQELKDRLSERVIPAKLIGLEDEYATLYDILNRTVSMGESNSCLILGGAGTGKTTIVRKAIKELTSLHGDNFFCIDLSGFIQTNDRLALQEISRQLSLQPQLEGQIFHSFADSLIYILNLLKSGNKDTSKPIIFILDEFDLFTQHNKQALLYNLFDVSQDNQAPVAIIGMTRRLDALFLLEKRVKSRFSHRQIHLYSAENFKTFTEIAKNFLRLDNDIEEVDSIYRQHFNERVEELFEETSFSRTVRHIFDSSKGIRGFINLCFGPIARLSAVKPFLLSSDFAEYLIQKQINAKIEIIKGITELELCLLVAIQHINLQQTPTFNFCMVYEEYKNFMNDLAVKGKSMRMRKWDAALKSFEHLVLMELVIPVEGAMKSRKEYRMMRVLLEPNEIFEAVSSHKDCPLVLKNWSQSSRL